MQPAELILKLLQFEDHPKKLVLKRNAQISSPSNINTNLYFIESGSVRIFVEDETEGQNIRFGYKGDIVVLMDSFLSGAASAYRVQALKKTTLTVISKAALTAFINHHPDHLKLWLAILEALVLQLLEREKDILTSSPAERYQRLLQRSPRLFQEISNHQIANYLRMSPETLSRLKKR